MRYPDKAGLYDLIKFSNALPSDPRFKKIKGLTAKILKQGSAKTDLNNAGHHLNAASDTEKALKSEHGVEPGLKHLAVGAMLSWSAILYTRATEPARRGPTRFSVRDKLVGDDFHWHEVIKDLRNDALAHFGAGPRPEYPWSDDALVLRVGPAAESPEEVAVKMFTAPKRTAYTSEVFTALGRLIPLAIQLLTEDEGENIQRFYTEYENLADSGSLVQKVLAQSEWNPRDLFGDAPYQKVVEHMMTSNGSFDFDETLFRAPKSYYGPSSEDQGL